MSYSFPSPLEDVEVEEEDEDEDEDDDSPFAPGSSFREPGTAVDEGVRLSVT
ncbi:MAG: hypothetical protein ACLFTI_06170 [Anaerolineales bacterium]